MAVASFEQVHSSSIRIIKKICRCAEVKLNKSSLALFPIKCQDLQDCSKRKKKTRKGLKNSFIFINTMTMTKLDPRHRAFGLEKTHQPVWKYHWLTGLPYSPTKSFPLIPCDETWPRKLGRLFRTFLQIKHSKYSGWPWTMLVWCLAHFELARMRSQRVQRTFPSGKNVKLE